MSKPVNFLSCVATAVLLTMLAACGSKNEGFNLNNWIRFSPANSGFSVLLPSQPIEDKPTDGSATPSKKFRIITAMSEIAALAISYADQPNNAGFETDPMKILNAVANQAVEEQRGELLEKTNLKIQNYPGVGLTMRIKGGFYVRQQVFLVNRRLISLMVTAGSKGLDSVEAEKFFGSFRLQ
jgi:hypothetical protein